MHHRRTKEHVCLHGCALHGHGTLQSVRMPGYMCTMHEETTPRMHIQCMEACKTTHLVRMLSTGKQASDKRTPMHSCTQARPHLRCRLHSRAVLVCGVLAIEASKELATHATLCENVLEPPVYIYTHMHTSLRVQHVHRG